VPTRRSATSAPSPPSASASGPRSTSLYPTPRRFTTWPTAPRPLKLAAKPARVGVERPGGRFGAISPDVAQQLPLREHSQRLGGQLAEKRELEPGQRKASAGVLRLERPGSIARAPTRRGPFPVAGLVLLTIARTRLGTVKARPDLGALHFLERSCVARPLRSLDSDSERQSAPAATHCAGSPERDSVRIGGPQLRAMWSGSGPRAIRKWRRKPDQRTPLQA
jgi:hypothetical protein